MEENTDLQGFQSLIQPGFIRSLHDIGGFLHFRHEFLEILINAIEAFGVIWQLTANVLGPDEDGFQMRPGSLDLEPDGDDLVGGGQLLLPGGHLLQEMSDELGRQHVL